MREYTILDSRWYSSGQGYLGMQIGVVAVHMPGHASGEWEVFIGFGHGLHKERDELEIVEYGAGLPAREAAGFFPQLDIQRYRRI